MVGRIFETESCDRKRYHNMTKNAWRSETLIPPAERHTQGEILRRRSVRLFRRGPGPEF